MRPREMASLRLCAAWTVGAELQLPLKIIPLEPGHARLRRQPESSILDWFWLEMDTHMPFYRPISALSQSRICTCIRPALIGSNGACRCICIPRKRSTRPKKKKDTRVDLEPDAEAFPTKTANESSSGHFTADGRVARAGAAANELCIEMIACLIIYVSGRWWGSLPSIACGFSGRKGCWVIGGSEQCKPHFPEFVGYILVCNEDLSCVLSGLRENKRSGLWVGGGIHREQISVSCKPSHPSPFLLATQCLAPRGTLINSRQSEDWPARDDIHLKRIRILNPRHRSLEYINCEPQSIAFVLDTY